MAGQRKNNRVHIATQFRFRQTNKAELQNKQQAFVILLIIGSGAGRSMNAATSPVRDRCELPSSTFPMIVEKFDQAVFSISDDSGFLALVNVERYKSFVSSNWSAQKLHQHFKEQSRAQTIFIWATGGEGFHNIAILPEPTTQSIT